MNIKSTAASIAMCGALSACAGTYSAQEGIYSASEFGEANRQTFAAMVINPDPVYAKALETSGQSAADAVERLRERRVVQPQAEDTRSAGGGGR